jgi:hypothetical protein
VRLDSARDVDRLSVAAGEVDGLHAAIFTGVCSRLPRAARSTQSGCFSRRLPLRPAEARAGRHTAESNSEQTLAPWNGAAEAWRPSRQAEPITRFTSPAQRNVPARRAA